MTLRQNVGRYDLERVLGKGGMGVVWLAHDPSLGRKVALKYLREDLVLTEGQREDLFGRMRIEARAAAHFTHPNIVTLHDFGEDEAIGPWLVFEYVEGPSLRDELKAGPFSKARLVQTARDVVAALAYAHERSVLHRDVKPENVLVSRNGLKLADFGVARLPDVQMTATGVLIGTPAYGAPESLRRGEFTPASDQFSLAVMLWELLKGSRPDTIDESSLPTHAIAETLGASGPASMGALHFHEADGAPSMASMASMSTIDARPGTKGTTPVERVLLRAMAARPADRYTSVRAFGDAFVLALDPHASIGPGSLRHAIGPSARERRTQTVALVVAALLLLALAFAKQLETGFSRLMAGASLMGGSGAVPADAAPPKAKKKVPTLPKTPAVARDLGREVANDKPLESQEILTTPTVNDGDELPVQRDD